MTDSTDQPAAGEADDGADDEQAESVRLPVFRGRWQNRWVLGGDSPRRKMTDQRGNSGP